MLTISADQSIAATFDDRPRIAPDEALRVAKLCRCANRLQKRELLAVWIASRRYPHTADVEAQYRQTLRDVDAGTSAVLAGESASTTFISEPMLRVIQETSLGNMRKYLAERAILDSAVERYLDAGARVGGAT